MQVCIKNKDGIKLYFLKKPEHKIVYNNYQFYENDVLTKFIEKQAAKGYYLCGIIGISCKILKFCHGKTEESKSYAIYQKHLEEQIDAEIENMKIEGVEIACENNQYIIFETSSSEATKIKSGEIEKRQNVLLGIPIKKSIALILILFILSILCLFLKLLVINKGNLYFNKMCFVLYLALNINFLFYFIGDLHDILAGKGTHTDGVLYFSNRTKFKDILFRIGDVLKWGLLLGSTCISIGFLLITKDLVIGLNIFNMWLILILSFPSKLRVRGSYIYLLILEILLVAFGSYFV